MMQSKRSLGIGAAALFTLTVFVLAAGSAQSQSIRLKANIPFAFYAGEKQLPAGTYELERYSAGFYRIFTRGENSAFFGTSSVRSVLGTLGWKTHIPPVWQGLHSFRDVVARSERRTEDAAHED